MQALAERTFFNLIPLYERQSVLHLNFELKYVHLYILALSNTENLKPAGRR